MSSNEKIDTIHAESEEVSAKHDLQCKESYQEDSSSSKSKSSKTSTTNACTASEKRRKNSGMRLGMHARKTKNQKSLTNSSDSIEKKI